MPSRAGKAAMPDHCGKGPKLAVVAATHSLSLLQSMF
jgi:hypothetical protein